MVRNKEYFFILLFLCISFGNVFCWKTFWKGRRSGGNLVAPHANVSELPPDQWFDQKLDHFDNSNNIQWKQVSYSVKSNSNS